MSRNPSDDARFRRVYDANVDAIRSYCIRRLPRNDVNDAMSDIFLVAWRRLDSVPSGDEATLWLYGVARNIVANQRRSRIRFTNLKKKTESVSPDVVDDPGVVVVQNAEAEEAIAALERLSPKDQEVVRLRVWEELSSAEIAVVVGSTPAAIDMRLSRARQRLNSYLSDDRSDRREPARPRNQRGGEHT